MSDEFLNKRVLVTGGCGSVGSALVKRLLQQGAGVVCVLDNREDGLFQLLQDLHNVGDRLRLFLGDVRDLDRVKRAMEGVHYVFHCAALKHVFFSEYNPFEATQTNVVGAKNIIDAAIENEVGKVILTSSDKAVNPTSTMGATKLLGERLFVAANHHAGGRKTRFACVRFGNVINSNGSVLHIFKRQLANGLPLTITSKSMTRFFLPMAEAVDLVLAAARRMVGGEIFALNMGTCDILTLAKVVSGKKPLRFEEIGFKPGEKLYEELITEDEMSRTVMLKDMYVILPSTVDLMPDELRAAYSIYRSENRLSGPLRSDANLLSETQVETMLRAAGAL